MPKTLISYIAGVLLAACPWIFYEAAFDTTPVFGSVGSSPPDFWTTFWNNLPDQCVWFVWMTLLVVIFTTPLYRFWLSFRGLSCPFFYTLGMAFLTGLINSGLIFYVLTQTGRAVKKIGVSPPNLVDYLDSFMSAGGILLLPFITTFIALLPELLFSQFLKKR